MQAMEKKVCAAPVRVKVFTLLTTLIANDLSVYKTVYTFLKVFTSLITNDLSVYTLYTTLAVETC
jgi:hypothetical protein